MKGLRQMKQKARDFSRWLRGWLYVWSVVRQAVSEYRRKGYFDFQTEVLTGCSDSIIYLVRYWHPRCMCRIIHRFPNGHGAIVTIADWSARTSSYQQISFPKHGSTWFETEGEPQHYWHLTDIMAGVGAIEALDPHPDDDGYENRVAREDRVWPELWIKKHPPTFD